MSYSQVKMDDLPPSLIERQTLAQSWDTNDGRIRIAITVDQKNQIFSEGDIITGSAVITADVDVYAPYIEVDFIGFSTTHWENPLMGAGVYEGKHSFLTMSCPVEEMTTLKARQPFKTNWEFTVPQQLLSTSCKHDADDDTRRAHLLLPSSMDHTWSKANPEVLKIIYGTRVRVNGLWSIENSDPALLAESLESIRFASAHVGRNNFFPPFDVNSYDSSVTQVLDSKKSSEMTVETTGLPSMTLDMAQIDVLPEEDRKRRATSVGLKLSFETTDAKVKPPEPTSVSAKLGISTSFSTMPTGRPPPLKRNIRSQGFALDTIKWPQRDMNKLNWSMHSENGKFKHEAYLVYPIIRCSLAQLVPTFDSCLVCRQYKISLKLTIRYNGTEYILRPEVPMLVAHDPAVSEH